MLVLLGNASSTSSTSDTPSRSVSANRQGGADGRQQPNPSQSRNGRLAGGAAVAFGRASAGAGRRVAHHGAWPSALGDPSRGGPDHRGRGRRAIPGWIRPDDGLLPLRRQSLLRRRPILDGEGKCPGYEESVLA